MPLSDTIKHIDDNLKRQAETDEANTLTLIPNENSRSDGEEIMRYVQEMRKLSWEIAGNYL
jgi:hypothetical protein